jgi:hypothetical protein
MNRNRCFWDIPRQGFWGCSLNPEKEDGYVNRRIRKRTSDKES